MGFYYLNMDKRNEKDFPSKLKYICISEPVKPTPENGKKSLTKAQKEEYQQRMDKHKKTIAAFESGHVDMYNNKTETSNIFDFGIDYLYSERNPGRIFKIKPIQSEREWQSGKYFVSEFDVVGEIKSEDDLLNELVKNYDYFHFIAKVWEQGTYANEGYREKTIEVIRKLNELASDDNYDSKQYLVDLIKNNDSCYGSIEVRRLNNNAYGFVKELLEKDLIVLTGKYDTKCSLVERLLKLKWTDLVLDVLKHETTTENDLKAIRDRHQIKNMLTHLTDDKNAREIIKLLGIETGVMTLIVEEDYDDGYATREVETKEFTDMNALRAYLITEYGVPFDEASGEIDGLYHDYYTFHLKDKE